MICYSDSYLTIIYFSVGYFCERILICYQAGVLLFLYRIIMIHLSLTGHCDGIGISVVFTLKLIEPLVS